MSSNVSLGSWVQIGHPAVAEILAQTGLEWLTLDCEHGEAENADIGNFCRACRQYNVKPYVRVKENAVMPIRRALDLGAQGIIVPLVNTKAEAEQAVKSANFPPDGIRGFAWQRGNEWGVKFDQYAKNFRPLVMVMVESKAAVENIDEILSVEGVDGILIGPYDMSGSYGIVGQTGHPVIIDACAKVASACQKHHKLAGSHIVTPNDTNVKLAIAQGYNFIALGMDSYFLQTGIKKALELIK
jgi:2-dehydro-3-deoxyglucarate aldolase